VPKQRFVENQVK